MTITTTAVDGLARPVISLRSPLDFTRDERAAKVRLFQELRLLVNTAPDDVRTLALDTIELGFTLDVNSAVRHLRCATSSTNPRTSLAAARLLHQFEATASDHR